MNPVISADQFAALVETGVNRIPVSRTLLADTETPLSTYNKLARGPRSFLFESVQGGERWGRYSIIGLTARTWLSVSGHMLRVYRDEQVVEERAVDDPLAEIEAIRARYHSATLPELPVFHGGWVGYFGYDTVRFVEPRLADTCPPDETDTPDIVLLLAEEVIIFDNLAGAQTLVINADTAVADT